jgi:hypothetical protein
VYDKIAGVGIELKPRHLSRTYFADRQAIFHSIELLMHRTIRHYKFYNNRNRTLAVLAALHCIASTYPMVQGAIIIMQKDFPSRK